MTPRLWIDVEDLFEYAVGNPRPSGIQRLAYEMHRDMQQRFGTTGLLHFVRHDPVRNSFGVVSWRELERLFAGLTRDAATSVPAMKSDAISTSVTSMPQMPAATATGLLMEPIRPHTRSRQIARKLGYRLSPAVRAHAYRTARSQMEAFRGYAALLKQFVRWGLAGLGGGRDDGALRRLAAEHVTVAPALAGGAPPQDMLGSPAPEPPPPSRFAAMVRPGDILFSLGSPWSHPDYGDLLRRHRERYGMRVAILVYDLIPLIRPEFCERGLVRLFRAWFEGTLPQCDAIFAISKASARDVESYAARHGYKLPGPVMPIPIGTGFSDDHVAAACAVGHLPAPGTYALIVSTIEARKNHLLIFRVWRRMMEELPIEQVPTLVFAGRVGWMVDDLLRMIANTNRLDGKLMIIENPSDTELKALYRGCMFTLFPSFYEGWGLPVTESLALGKPCLIADRTSLPEAGGTLARRFDPDNLHDAYAKIRDTVLDIEGLLAWEARVRQEFRPVAWSETVDALLEGMEHPLAVREVQPAE